MDDCGSGNTTAVESAMLVQQSQAFVANHSSLSDPLHCTRMHGRTRCVGRAGACVRACACNYRSFQDDDVKVMIDQPDAESAGSTPVAFVEGRMNCAAATAVMDMKVRYGWCGCREA